jgi:hypothetical protein
MAISPGTTRGTSAALARIFSVIFIPMTPLPFREVYRLSRGRWGAAMASVAAAHEAILGADFAVQQIQ